MQIYWADTSQATLFESVSLEADNLLRCQPWSTRRRSQNPFRVIEQTSKVLVDHALKGVNSCCFAYGQTGSGKTFRLDCTLPCLRCWRAASPMDACPLTMLHCSSPPRCDILSGSSIFGEPGEKAGLLSRSIEYLFDMVGRYEAKAKVRSGLEPPSTVDLSVQLGVLARTRVFLAGELGSHARGQLSRDLLRSRPRPRARVSAVVFCPKRAGVLKAN